MSSPQNQDAITKEILQDYVKWVFSYPYTSSGAPGTKMKMSQLIKSSEKLTTTDKTGFRMMKNTGVSMYELIGDNNWDLASFLSSVPLELEMQSPPSVCGPCRPHPPPLPPAQLSTASGDSPPEECPHSIPIGAQCLTGAWPPRVSEQVPGLPTCDLCKTPDSCAAAVCGTKDNPAPNRPKAPAPLTGVFTGLAPQTKPAFIQADGPLPTAFNFTFTASTQTMVLFLTNRPMYLMGTYNNGTPNNLWRLFKVSLQSLANPTLLYGAIEQLSKTDASHRIGVKAETLLTMFLSENMKWLRRCCVDNQLLDPDVSNLLCQTKNGDTYTSDIYGLPTEVCDEAALRYCVGGSKERKDYCKVKDEGESDDACFYRNMNDPACTCFDWTKDGAPWRGNSTDLEDDATLGDGYDAAMYKFMKQYNPTSISRKCIVNNCKDADSYKTANMMRAKCPHMCTSILHRSIDEQGIDADNHSNVDISDTTVTVRCGSAEKNFFQGAGSPPGSKKPDPTKGLKWWIYLLIGLAVAGVIGGVIAYVIVRRKRERNKNPT